MLFVVVVVVIVYSIVLTRSNKTQRPSFTLIKLQLKISKNKMRIKVKSYMFAKSYLRKLRHLCIPYTDTLYMILLNYFLRITYQRSLLV